MLIPNIIILSLPLCLINYFPLFKNSITGRVPIRDPNYWPWIPDSLTQVRSTNPVLPMNEAHLVKNENPRNESESARLVFFGLCCRPLLLHGRYRLGFLYITPNLIPPYFHLHNSLHQLFSKTLISMLIRLLFDEIKPLYSHFCFYCVT